MRGVAYAVACAGVCGQRAACAACARVRWEGAETLPCRDCITRGANKNRVTVRPALASLVMRFGCLLSALQSM